MKKAAAAGLLLALLLGASLWNLRILNNAIADMTGWAELCRSFCQAGNTEEAENALAKAAERWDGLHVYAHIFLRQTETDAVEDAIREVLSCLRSGDTKAAEAALDWLERRLSAMAEMERITLESVF